MEENKSEGNTNSLFSGKVVALNKTWICTRREKQEKTKTQYYSMYYLLFDKIYILNVNE